MKTLSNHIQGSFAPVKEEQQIVIENQTITDEEVFNEENMWKKKNLPE